jgi:nicotinamide riboside kinase
MSLKKFVIIGPESTGKSTLCLQLAEHYKTVWCPEFAREYLEKKGMDYTYDDLLTIAKRQIELEESKMSDVRCQMLESETNYQQSTINYKPFFIETCSFKISMDNKTNDAFGRGSRYKKINKLIT